MDMPEVFKCSVTNCAYNNDEQCHALAITVGDGANPRCDTFTEAGFKGGDEQEIGRVGACKVSVCRFNESLECQAQGIEVGNRDGGVFCMTFSWR